MRKGPNKAVDPVIIGYFPAVTDAELNSDDRLASAFESYYLSFAGNDSSAPYLAYLIGLARSAGRSENLRMHSRLEADQIAEPELKAVNLSCGKLQWETNDRVRAAGNGQIAPMPGYLAIKEAATRTPSRSSVRRKLLGRRIARRTSTHCGPLKTRHDMARPIRCVPRSR